MRDCRPCRPSDGVALVLRQRLEQPGAEAGVAGAQRGRAFGAAVGDAPVTGRRVVHRVVKARRRDQPLSAREREADLVAVVAIATRGGEDRRQRAGIGLRAGHRFGAHRERDFDYAAGSTPFRRRQYVRQRQHGAQRDIGRLVVEHGARSAPVGEPRSEQPQSLNAPCQVAHQRRYAARPNSSAQLAPPKPNELLSTRRSGPRRFSVR